MVAYSLKFNDPCWSCRPFRRFFVIFDYIAFKYLLLGHYETDFNGSYHDCLFCTKWFFVFWSVKKHGSPLLKKKWTAVFSINLKIHRVKVICMKKFIFSEKNWTEILSTKIHGRFYIKMKCRLSSQVSDSGSLDSLV